jgi:hypothetical protein
MRKTARAYQEIKLAEGRRVEDDSSTWQVCWRSG